jgi:DNA-binding SARP family transcriptional activator
VFREPAKRSLALLARNIHRVRFHPPANRLICQLEGTLGRKRDAPHRLGSSQVGVRLVSNDKWLTRRESVGAVMTGPAGVLSVSRAAGRLGASLAQFNGVGYELKLFQRWQLLDEQAEVPVAWRQQRLISALAIYGSRHRRYLGGLLWPDSPEERAMESLRVSVHLLSRQVPGLLVKNGPMLTLGSELRVDVHKFLEQVENCEQANVDGPHDACLTCLLGAELLPGWYEDWVILEQHRLRKVRLHALLAHAKRWLDRGEVEKALEAAQGALELEPLHEACVCLLMQAELKVGNRAGALRAFGAFKASLDADLGIAPSDYLSSFAASIRGQVSPQTKLR